MKKKIALLLSVLSVVMMLSACGTTDPTKVDYNGVTYEQLYDQSVSLGTALKDKTAEEVKSEMNNALAAGEEYAFVADLCAKWIDAMEVSGKYVGYDKDAFTVTKSGKTLTTDLMLKF